MYYDYDFECAHWLAFYNERGEMYKKQYYNDKNTKIRGVKF